MAKQDKGQERARRGTPRWRPPQAEDIKPGDTLQYFSIDTRFIFTVMSLQHKGEWIFGRDARDPDPARAGLVAVRRADCMTLAQADSLLQDFPTFQLDRPGAEALPPPEQV